MKSKELDVVAETYCVAFEPTDIEAFKAGWNEALKSAPEVKALVETLEIIEIEHSHYVGALERGSMSALHPFHNIFTKCGIHSEKVLAAFRAAVGEK